MLVIAIRNPPSYLLTPTIRINQRQGRVTGFEEYLHESINVSRTPKTRNPTNAFCLLRKLDMTANHALSRQVEHLADDAVEDGPHAAGAPVSEGHDDSGNDE